MFDLRNNSNDTALDIALITSKRKNFDVLLSKFNQKNKINTLNKRGLCYLSLAILITNIDFVKHMIEDLGFDPNDKGDFKEENPDLHNYPIHQAIICQSKDILKYLLNLPNINGNIRDEMKNNDSALHIACKIPNFASVCILIESKKINVNIKNKDGDNCLMAMMRKYNDIKYGINVNKNEYIQILFFILSQNEFDLNDKGKNGETLLHLIRNHTDILMKLAQLKLNINTNVKDDNGKTAIDLLLDDYSPKFLNVCTILYFGNYEFNEKIINSDVIFFILKKMPSFELFKKFVKNGLDLNHISKRRIFFF